MWLVSASMAGIWWYDSTDGKDYV